ncbi:unnamed protein product, partial [Ectocarpus sp. 6 AP-2014]
AGSVLSGLGGHAFLAAGERQGHQGRYQPARTLVPQHHQAGPAQQVDVEPVDLPGGPAGSEGLPSSGKLGLGSPKKPEHTGSNYNSYFFFFDKLLLLCVG